MRDNQAQNQVLMQYRVQENTKKDPCKGNTLFFKTFRPALGTPSLLLRGYRGFFPGLKRSGREVNHLAVYSAAVKNEWSCTSTPSIRLHGVDRDNCSCILQDWRVRMRSRSSCVILLLSARCKSVCYCYCLRDAKVSVTVTGWEMRDCLLLFERYETVCYCYCLRDTKLSVTVTLWEIQNCLLLLLCCCLRDTKLSVTVSLLLSERYENVCYCFSVTVWEIRNCLHLQLIFLRADCSICWSHTAFWNLVEYFINNVWLFEILNAARVTWVT